MRKILTLLTLLLSGLTAYASYDPLSNDVFTPGGSNSGSQAAGVTPSSSASQLKTLYAGVLNQTTGQFLILYDSGSPYHVTPGKTFVVQEVWAYTTALADHFGFFTGTSALASDNSVSAPPGVIYYNGGGGKSVIWNDAAGAYRQYRMPITFGTNTWPGVQPNGGAGNNLNVIVYGREL